MSKLKEKFNILNIVIAVLFIYMAFAPYFISLSFNVLQGTSLKYTVQSFFNLVFDFSYILNFIGAIAIAVGVFTKFDKLITAGGMALFWFAHIFILITTIIDTIFKNYYYSTPVATILSQLANVVFYFVMFAIITAFALFPLLKKPTPSFLKYLIFIPIAILLFISIYSFFQNVINLIKYISYDFGFRTLFFYFLNAFFAVLGTIVRLIGLSAVFLKISEFSFKKKIA